MREIEFKRPGAIIRSIEEIDEDEKEFVRIAEYLVKSLGWNLVDRIEIDVLIWSFQKNDIEISLVYNDMCGMFLRTKNETFALEPLFKEINDMLKLGGGN